MDTATFNLSPKAQRWLIPLSKGKMPLGDALADMRSCGDAQDDIPFLVQLVENPRFHVVGFDPFHGRVDLLAHDCIHILLGRGMMAKDEAFVIGFTMGSTNRVNATEEKLFTFIARNLYPGVYRFTQDDIDVFRDALRLGFVSDCAPLDQVDYSRLLGLSLDQIRDRLSIEAPLLQAFYQIEAKRYPDAPESQRLIA